MLSSLLGMLNSWKWRFRGVCGECCSSRAITVARRMSVPLHSTRTRQALGGGLARADAYSHSRMCEKTQQLDFTASRIPCRLTLRERKLRNMHGTSVNAFLLLGLREFQWTLKLEVMRTFCAVLPSWRFHRSVLWFWPLAIVHFFCKCVVCVSRISRPPKNV